MADISPIDSAVSAARADIQAAPSTIPVTQQTPYPQDQFSQVQDKQARDASTTKTDILGAEWRQDSWISGAIDHYAGAQLAPDENYNPYRDDDTHKALVEGVWPQFQDQLTQASSAGQAAWLKQNILEKQDDLTKLGDLDGAGKAGRFAAGMAFGFVDPINLAAMAASGGTSLLVRGAATAARVAEGANVVSRLTPIASGLGTAGILGVATEKLRQNYNFEDDSMGVLTAGLTSMAFAAPFIGLHAHEQARVAKTAGLEKQAIDVMTKQQAGVPITDAESATLKQYSETLKKATDVEAGRADPSTFVGPAEGRPRVKFTDEQRKAYEDAFAQHDAEQAAKKETDLTGVEQSGNTQRVEDVLGAVHGPDSEPNAMQVAFAKALGKKPEEIAPKVKAPVPDAPWAGEHEAPKKVWWDDGTGINEGDVQEHNLKTGDLTVADPDTGAVSTVNTHDLHELSPGKTKAPAYDNPADHSVFGMADSIGAARVDPSEHIQSLAEQPTAMTHLGKVPIRWDFYTQINQSGNPHLQFLAHKLIKDAIGNDTHEAQGWTASELKAQFRRTMEGAFHVEAQHALDGIAQTRKLNIFQKTAYKDQFYNDLTKVARGDVDILKANPDIAPHLQKAAKGLTDFYTDMRRKMLDAGVEGADGIPDNPQYVNRQWKQDNIRDAFRAYGNQMYEVIGRALKLEGVSGDAATAKAKGFMDAVMKLEFSHALQDINLHARDLVTLREELTNSGLKDHEINSLVDLLFERKAGDAGDTGNPGPLKYRMALDENHMERMEDGSVFKVSDLFENDSRNLSGRYMNSMGGHLALAEVGIKSRAEFARRMKAAEDHQADNSMTTGAAKFNRAKQLTQDAYDNITGRPMSTQSFNRLDRILNGMRAFARSAMLGQLGIPAALEMKNAVGLTSMRAAMQHMPTFAKIIRSFQAGHPVPEGMDRVVHALTGHGLEHVSAYSRQHEIADGTYDHGLTWSDRMITKFENGTAKLSHAVDYLSGNSFVTAATRKMAAIMSIQKHVDYATGKIAMTDSLRERMTHNGVGTDDQPTIHDALKKYATLDDGKIDNLDYEKWSKESPESYSKFQLLISREVRDQIQDHDLGETIPFMHTTVGKIFSELKTFVLVGHAKQFLKSMHYRDSTTAVQWMYSFVGAALEYSFQNSVNFAGDQETLQKRLTPQAIAMGAVSRMSVLGMLPNLMDTAYQPISGGQSLFNGTANTDNRNIFLTPSMIMGARLATLTQVAGSSVNPFSTNTITQKNMQDALYAIPGGNLFGMRNLNNYVSSSFPKFAPRQQQ